MSKKAEDKEVQTTMTTTVEVEQHGDTAVIEIPDAPELDYHVIASGSRGNAVRIENIMIDCGIPFNRMREDLYLCDTLLITHAHNDHLVIETYNHIRKEFPRIKVYANYDVAYRVDVDKVIGTSELRLNKGRTVIPFDLVHDVPCTGFIIKINDTNILYATDTSQVNLPCDIPLDYLFLESNYDEIKLRAIGGQFKAGRYNPYDANLRHLSTQRCKDFYYINRRNKNSILIELHKSSRFY